MTTKVSLVVEAEIDLARVPTKEIHGTPVRDMDTLEVLISIPGLDKSEYIGVGKIIGVER